MNINGEFSRFAILYEEKKVRGEQGSKRIRIIATPYGMGMLKVNFYILPFLRRINIFYQIIIGLLPFILIENPEPEQITVSLQSNGNIGGDA